MKDWQSALCFWLPYLGFLAVLFTPWPWLSFVILFSWYCGHAAGQAVAEIVDANG